MSEGLHVISVVAGTALITGVVITWPNLRDTLRAMRSMDWPITRGTITSSRVIYRHRRASRRKPSVYKAIVHYTYEVHGQEYTCDRIYFGTWHTNVKAYADSIVACYPTGSNPNVSYNPGSPDIAVLEPGLTFARSWALLFMLCAGFFFLCFGAVVLILGLPRVL